MVILTTGLGWAGLIMARVGEEKLPQSGLRKKLKEIRSISNKKKDHFFPQPCLRN